MDVEDVFRESGVTPRPGQVEVARALSRALEDDISVVFTAPTGWGKTLVTLAALKASERLPALWLVRSLELGRRISEDAVKLGLSVFIAAGKLRTCPLYEAYGDAIYAWCRRNIGKCVYFERLLVHGDKIPALKPGEGVAISWKDLRDVVREDAGDLCFYYAQEHAAKWADLVVQSYYRKRMLCLATIIDEAHNVVVPRQKEVPFSVFSRAVGELRSIGFHDLSEEVEAILRRTGKLPFEKLPLAQLEWALLEGVENLSKLRGLPILTRTVKVCQLGGVAYRDPLRDVIEVYEPPWRAKDPAIYISATLPRGVEDILRVEASVRIPPVKRRAFVLKWLTTKYQRETWREYKKLLTSLKFKFRRVLAFTTERVALGLLDSVNIYEPELENGIPKNWNGVLLLHARGRFAEGIDLRADCVVMLGTPFLPPEVVARLRRAYRMMGGDGRMAYWLPVLITTVQCTGRARNPDAVVLLADERYAKIEGIDEYFEIEEIESLEELKRRLEHVR